MYSSQCIRLLTWKSLRMQKKMEQRSHWTWRQFRQDFFFLMGVVGMMGLMGYTGRPLSQ